MGDEPTNGETRAERIKREWDEGEPERAARRADREAARQPGREAVGLLRRTGRLVAGQGLRLLLTLIFLAVVVALPAVVVGAFVDSHAGATVGGVMLGLVVCACVIVLSAGTKYSGDW
ncbi:MAG TPA: hypothetical protein VFV62_00945 [Gaiellaceae bacterium]|nr:hypothetical protein [Gaiellaceae bacterium]